MCNRDKTTMLSPMLRKFWYHPWTVGVCNLALLFVLYTLSRWFYFVVNHDLYADVGMAQLWRMTIGGIRFDITALFYLNALYMLMQFNPLPVRNNAAYQKVAKRIFQVINILGICVNMIDVVYSRFSGQRTTMLFFSEFKHDDNLADILFRSVFEYRYVSLFTVFLVLCLILCTRSTARLYMGRGKVTLIKRYFFETTVFCVSIYFIVIGIRGGFGAYTRPLKISNATLYVNEVSQVNVVLNTPFTLLMTLNSERLRNPGYFAETEYTPVHIPTTKNAHIGKNVVILIVESLSKEYIGFYNDDLDNGTYRGYTPFLDSLLEHSVSFNHSFATGRKSIDAMPSILASLPCLGKPFIVSPYATNKVFSVAHYLSQKGYNSAFFHGAPNGSMGFEAFASITGFEHCYGKTEYNNNADFDGTWAIWDEEFLQFYARMTDTLTQPFVTSVFTASSHHPFKIPKRYKNVFPEGKHPIHQCIAYTDHALKLFFNHAKKQTWYTNTLFVITGDHTNALSYPQYLNAKGIFEIPVIFYDAEWENTTPPLPLGKENMTNTTPVSQADILPSVLEYVGYDKPYLAFGENILTDNKKTPYVVLFNNPVYQCFSNRLLMQFDGEKITAVYDYEKDKRLTHNVMDELIQTEEVQDMLRFTKEYIQQYISRMIENKLTVNDSIL